MGSRRDALLAIRAAGARIQMLYHYENFDAEHLEDTLVDQRVHVSNPKNFNDPWDCYPCFDTTRMTDPAFRARCIREVFPRIPGLPAARQQYYEAKLQADGHFFSEMLRTEFRESFRNTILERWRVFCLTPHPDMSLMWSHYADKHRGVCLEFDARHAVIGNAWQVQYSDALPMLDILALTGESAFRILVTKSPDWRYENEYRILARDGEAYEVAPLPITHNDFLSLPAGALTAVIAGCRANFDEIKALMEKHAPGMPVKRAVQASDRYSLSIQT
jgi:hypothetical protein